MTNNKLNNKLNEQDRPKKKSFKNICIRLGYILIFLIYTIIAGVVFSNPVTINNSILGTFLLGSFLASFYSTISIDDIDKIDFFLSIYFTSIFIIYGYYVCFILSFKSF